MKEDSAIDLVGISDSQADEYGGTDTPISACNGLIASGLFGIESDDRACYRKAVFGNSSLDFLDGADRP